MSATALSSKALALRTKFADSFLALLHKKNAVVLAPTADHQKRFCNDLIDGLVSPIHFLFLIHDLF